MKLWADIESRSDIPIKRGVLCYSQQGKAEILLVQWAVDDGPVHVDDLTAGDSLNDFLDAAVEADEIWAHGEFDHYMLEDHLPQWPIRFEIGCKWRCTMSLARLHGLPGGLDKLSAVFKLEADEAKDARGKALIQLFCVPKKDGTYNDRHSHPVEWEEFKAYGDQDIVAMRAVYRKLPKWNSTEDLWRKWHLDQIMNRRGVACDLKLAEGAVYETTKAKKRYADRTADLTELDVQSTTQRDRLLAYMEGYGVTLPDLKADTVERRLEDESLPEHIKELLRIRQQASKASTAKYKRVLTQQVGGRLRNLLVFCGAMRTGRWSGRTLQPQNLPRPKHSAGDIAGAIVAFHEKAMDIYDPDNCLGLASSCLRGLIVAGPRCKLVVADLANIEGRDMAFIAGEQWKLDAFAKFDAGLGPDMYKLSYGRAFGIDPNTIGDDDERRQIGKVMELALQYYGGVGAFCAMAETYGLKLEHLAESAWKSIPAGVLSRAREAFRRATKRRKTYGLDERTYLVCQSLVLMWRDAHPAIVKFWADLDTAFRSAIRTENVAYKAGKVVVDRKGNWVRIKLPSGRYLSYPGTRVGADDNQMRFMGVNPYSRQWGRIGTYNGKLAENIVQASSADILMDGIMAAEMAGYSPEISVHDEIISEPPDSPEYTAAGLSKLMCESSAWTKGMPLSAKGWEGQRYRK